MKLSLYNIQTEFLQLTDALIENGGEITPEIEEALQFNKDNLETKGSNYGLIVKQLEAETEVINAEIARLTNLKKSRSNTVDRLKQSLSVAMELYGIEEIKTPLLKINFRKSESVEIISEAILDGKFKIAKTTIQIDKVAIKEAIKAGDGVAGAILKQNKNIQIK